MKTKALMWAVLLACSGCATVVVGPGQTGVLWTAHGGTQAGTFGEGAHWMDPSDAMSIYDLRTTAHDEALEVIRA